MDFSYELPLLLGLGGGLLALLYAAWKSRWIMAREVPDEKLKRIGGYVAKGAMAFLARENKVLLPFAVAAAILLFFGSHSFLKWEAATFLIGAGCSALAGYFGMKIATQSNFRTTWAARSSLNEALKVSFAGGSVMGMSVMGLALIGISAIMFATLSSFGREVSQVSMWGLPILSGFALGASCIALFARVGGGIYTKAADVGADLVGKVEAGIPEDDPRNPATIADNVGDNVGDVAGMGADLYESFVATVLGCMILGLAVDAPNDLKIALCLLPLTLGAGGVVASILGMSLVRVREGGSPQAALNKGTFAAAALSAVFSWPIFHFTLGGRTFGDGIGANNLFWATVIGVVGGTAIGLLTEYYTGTGRKPVDSIAKASETGPATNIITGMGVGMASTALPILVMAATVLLGYWQAGLFGVAIATLGVQLFLGIQLAVDAFGPIADNAGGLAEMSEQPPGVRANTDKLDAVGNTTAAIGKGFATASAALTSVVLFSAFKEETGVGTIEITDPMVLIGLLVGGMVPYLFSSSCMMAVGRAAFAMVEEVRRQFRTIAGILEGKTEPDYGRCIDISTRAALREMIIPGVLAILSPVAVGFLGGVPMLTGYLIGVTVSGVALAIFMSNTGGAWDNAKKTIEAGAAGGKGSDAHKASVVGDTVGDPFKDTAGPALNILIKLMGVMSVVIAPMLKRYWGY
ncbi:MAG TPA: sodium-translocating pyrophosphatase [Fibrobacteria bacterium]|nr:sodium-translocating pyrophosphatase [Fibrobacteria bacterium]